MRTALSTCGMASTRFEAGGNVAHAHHADHHPLLALDGVHLVTEVLNALADLFDLLLASSGASSK